ncbi:MAG: AAA family ATPase [Pseudomonadota bacterium]
MDLNEVLAEGFTPTTDEDWETLSALSNQIFDPRSPIDDAKLFSGRLEQINDVLEAVYQKGGHAVIFGERGVGKTSLAKIIDKRVAKIMGRITVKFISCGVNDDFYTIWGNAFNDHTAGEIDPASHFKNKDNPYEVYKAIVDNLTDGQTIYIFDEFDRIRDKDALFLMADLMKHFSNNPVKATVVIVGVGETLNDLFDSHESVARCCSQVKMPRMEPNELSAIMSERFPRMGILLAEGVSDKIVKLSQGLPGYVHLMSQLCLRSAIDRKSTTVTEDDLKFALSKAVDKADQRTRQDYYKAINSSRTDSKYEEVLIACALAESNELGWFYAGSVRDPYSKIRGKQMEIPNFSTNLANLCADERGPTLIKSGIPKRYQYRFANPLLQPLAVMVGVQKGLIPL